MQKVCKKYWDDYSLDDFQLKDVKTPFRLRIDFIKSIMNHHEKASYNSNNLMFKSSLHNDSFQMARAQAFWGTSHGHRIHKHIQKYININVPKVSAHLGILA